MQRITVKALCFSGTMQELQDFLRHLSHHYTTVAQVLKIIKAKKLH